MNFSLESYLKPHNPVLDHILSLDLSDVELPTVESIEDTHLIDDMAESQIVLKAALCALDKLNKAERVFKDQHISEFTMECFMDELNVSLNGVITFTADQIFVKDGETYALEEVGRPNLLAKLVGQTKLIIKKLLDALNGFIKKIFNLNKKRHKETLKLIQELDKIKQFNDTPVQMNNATLPIFTELGKEPALLTTGGVEAITSAAASFSIEKIVSELETVIKLTATTTDQQESAVAKVDNFIEGLLDSYKSHYGVYKEEQIAGKPTILFSLLDSSFNNGFRVIVDGFKTSAVVDIDFKAMPRDLQREGGTNVSLEQVKAILMAAESIFGSATSGDEAIKSFSKNLQEFADKLGEKEVPDDIVKFVGTSTSITASVVKSEQQYLQRVANAGLAVALGMYRQYKS